MLISYGAVFILGLLIGSFLNVCIYRIPKKESIVFPPSKCINCDTKLKPLDLIPIVSWLLSKGKCRYCREPVSIRYPLVEFLTAIVFMLIYFRYGFSVEFLGSAYIMSILIAVIFIDIKYLIIPNKLVLAALIGAVPILIYNFFKTYMVYINGIWWDPLVAGVVSFLILLLIAILSVIIYRSSDAFGMGDVKIYLPIGFYLGMELTFLSIFLSTVIGGIIGILLLMTGRLTRRSAMPFGPFISVSVFLCLIWGRDILIGILTYLYG